MFRKYELTIPEKKLNEYLNMLKCNNNDVNTKCIPPSGILQSNITFEYPLFIDITNGYGNKSSNFILSDYFTNNNCILPCNDDQCITKNI